MNERRILLIDDDEGVHTVLRRAFGAPPNRLISAYGGPGGLFLAAAEKPDVIVLDVNMPEQDGREVLKELRGDIRTRSVPVVMLTGNGDLPDKLAGFELGADDYMSKPFALTELKARVESLCRRRNRDLSANPLTGLPGAPVIEEEVSRRIRKGIPFVFFYVDIDHFKPFNDLYGYVKGDRVIRETAELLSDTLAAFDGARNFVGHIGGDDFVAIASPENAEAAAAEVARRFDARVPGYYSAADGARGYVVCLDRQGQEKRFPLVSLSIALVTSETRRLEHYAKVADVAAEIKRYLKGRPDRRGSAYLKDRRMDDGRRP